MHSPVPPALTPECRTKNAKRLMPRLPMQCSSAQCSCCQEAPMPECSGQQAIVRRDKMHRILLPPFCNAGLRTTIRTIEAPYCRSPPAWVSLPPTTGATFGLLFLQMSCHGRQRKPCETLYRSSDDRLRIRSMQWKTLRHHSSIIGCFEG